MSMSRGNRYKATSTQPPFRPYTRDIKGRQTPYQLRLAGRSGSFDDTQGVRLPNPRELDVNGENTGYGREQLLIVQQKASPVVLQNSREYRNGANGTLNSPLLPTPLSRGGVEAEKLKCTLD